MSNTIKNGTEKQRHHKASYYGDAKYNKKWDGKRKVSWKKQKKMPRKRQKVIWSKQRKATKNYIWPNQGNIWWRKIKKREYAV